MGGSLRVAHLLILPGLFLFASFNQVLLFHFCGRTDSELSAVWTLFRHLFITETVVAIIARKYHHNLSSLLQSKPGDHFIRAFSASFQCRIPYPSMFFNQRICLIIFRYRSFCLSSSLSRSRIPQGSTSNNRWNAFIGPI